MLTNDPEFDAIIANDQWSDLTEGREPPQIDFDRLHSYRIGRIRAALVEHDAALCILVNPISLRYPADYRSYALFQSHIPTAYLFVPQSGPTILFNGYGDCQVDEMRKGREISYYAGARELPDRSRLLAEDVVTFLGEIGTDNRRVMVEYVNPTLTQALMRRGLDVADGVTIAEEARIIKSPDEIACMKWAIAVAELGIKRMREALRPGVSELQLWAILNYTNLANNGDWHEGRMLASGDRINPWLQEASPRRIEDGDLVGLDTDMVGPFGYFADISRTFHRGPLSGTASSINVPSRRWKTTSN